MSSEKSGAGRADGNEQSRLEQKEVNARGKKRGRSEWSKKIGEEWSEKSGVEREKNREIGLFRR